MSRKKAVATTAAIEGFLVQAHPGQFNAVLAGVWWCVGKRRVSNDVMRMAE